MALGHEAENLPFTLAEVIQRGAHAARLHEGSDDLRVQGRTSSGYPVERRIELVQIENPVLQEPSGKTSSSAKTPDSCTGQAPFHKGRNRSANGRGCVL